MPEDQEQLEIPSGPEEVQEKPGTPEDYGGYLIENRDNVLAHILKGLREQGKRPPFEDYTQSWIVNPKKAAAYIRARFPKAKGFEAFARGLEAPPLDENKVDNPEFVKSYETLKLIIEHLKKRDQFLHEGQEKRETLIRKEGAVSETLKSGVSNLIRRFKEGSTTEKILTLAAAGILIKTLMWLKDRKMFGTDYTYGRIMGFAAAGWAINAVSGKISKDGKTLLQRIDIGTPMEDVKGTMWSLFALDGEKEKQQLAKPNEHKIMFAFGNKDIKPVAEMYKKYLVRRRNEFTKADLTRMGFGPLEAGGIDGKIAFTVVDKLFRRAGKNYFLRWRVEEARRRKSSPEEIKLEEYAKSYEELGYTAIERKYLIGQRASQKWTFEEVISEEMLAWAELSGGIDKLFAELEPGYDENKLPAQTLAAGKDAFKKTKDFAEKHGSWAGKKLWGFAGTIAKTFKSGYEAAKKRVDKYFGKHKEDEIALQSILALDDITIEVTGPGEVKVMDYPTTFERKGEGAKRVYKIEGIPVTTLSPEKARKELKAKITGKVKKAVKEAPIKGNVDVEKITWDKTALEWFIPGIDVKGIKGLGIPDKKKAKLVIKFDAKGKAHFEISGEKVDDLNKINKQYQHGEIIGRIRAQMSFLDEISSGRKADDKLPVRIKSITAKGGQTIVIGDIAGSHFAARKATGGFGFQYSKDGKTFGGIDQIDIGADYPSEKIKQVSSSLEFMTPFQTLNNAIQNVEGLDPRIAAEFEYLIAFKQAETLAFFEEALNGAVNMRDAEKAQNDHIGNRLLAIKNLFNRIEAIPHAQKAAKLPKVLSDMENFLYDPKNKDYLDIYHEFFRQVRDRNRYTLGATGTKLNSDLPIINHIRHAWSYHTMELAVKKTLTADEIKYLRKVRNEMLAVLNKAMTEGLESHIPTGKRIFLRELPETPDKWI